MTPPPLNQADIIASEAAKIAADKAALDTAIAGREALKSELATRKANEAELWANANRGDAAAVRALTEARAGRELTERDLAKTEDTIAALLRTMPDAVMQLVRRLEERSHALDDQINQRRAAVVAQACACEPFRKDFNLLDEAESQLSPLRIRLADLNFTPRSEHELLRSSDRSLAAFDLLTAVVSKVR